MFNAELLLNAAVAGLLLGGFYAAVSVGLALSFGLLDIVNIAHPAFAILGGYGVYVLNTHYGVDPILSGLLFAPLFYGLGWCIYRIYYVCFEQRGQESMRGLVFFFGVLFLVEVGLLLTYGVDYRLAQASYIGASLNIGMLGISFRLLVPFVVGLLLALGLYLFLSRTYVGRMVMGVAQDSTAVRLMGANPVSIKSIAFGLSIATACVAGALMIIIGPIEPSLGREFIGRTFAVAVLGGLGSISGALIAALVLGLAESLTATFFGPSWTLAVLFGVLLLVLAVKPSGLMGRPS